MRISLHSLHSEHSEWSARRGFRRCKAERAALLELEMLDRHRSALYAHPVLAGAAGRKGCWYNRGPSPGLASPAARGESGREAHGLGGVQGPRAISPRRSAPWGAPPESAPPAARVQVPASAEVFSFCHAVLFIIAPSTPLQPPQREPSRPSACSPSCSSCSVSRRAPCPPCRAVPCLMAMNFHEARPAPPGPAQRVLSARRVPTHQKSLNVVVVQPSRPAS